MPSIYNEHNSKNGGSSGVGERSEATPLLLDQSSTNMNHTQVGDYLGFTGSLDEDIDAIGMAESTLECATNTQSSDVPNKRLTYESQVNVKLCTLKIENNL